MLGLCEKEKSRGDDECARLAVLRSNLAGDLIYSTYYSCGRRDRAPSNLVR